MKLQQLINIADQSYPDGLIGLYAEKPKVNHGDLLAKFIACELTETFDPDADTSDQMREAIRVMKSARREIDAVLGSLESYA